MQDTRRLFSSAPSSFRDLSSSRQAVSLPELFRRSKTGSRADTDVGTFFLALGFQIVGSLRLRSDCHYYDRFSFNRTGFNLRNDLSFTGIGYCIGDRIHRLKEYGFTYSDNLPCLVHNALTTKPPPLPRHPHSSHTPEIPPAPPQIFLQWKAPAPSDFCHGG